MTNVAIYQLIPIALLWLFAVGIVCAASYIHIVKPLMERFGKRKTYTLEETFQ